VNLTPVKELSVEFFLIYLVSTFPDYCKSELPLKTSYETFKIS